MALTVDTTGHPPHALLVRGAAEVAEVGGVPDEYVAGSRELVPPDAFPAREAGVRALYERMVRITITPDHAVLLDPATTVPRAVADLVRAASR